MKIRGRECCQEGGVAPGRADHVPDGEAPIVDTASEGALEAMKEEKSMAGRSMAVAVVAALLLLPVALGQSVEPSRKRSVERIEISIQSAIRFLYTKQKADGSFQCDKYPTAVTGLACLAILANHGDGSSPQANAAVRKGVDFILSQQADNGMVGVNMYEHAIGSLAALQLLGMGERQLDPRLSAFCQKSLDLSLGSQVITKAKRNVGGWTYSATDVKSDLSNTSWQLLLLYSARQCGYAVDPGVLKQCLSYINQCAQKDGYGYTPPFTRRSGESHRSLTGVALFLKEILDPGSMEREAAVVKWLTDVQPAWGSAQYRGYFFCSSFYMTQGIFQMGGDLWDRYFNDMVAVLLDHQESDGHWPFPPDDLEEERKAGVVYSTAMSVLMLSLEKQYLPIYARQREIVY